MDNPGEIMRFCRLCLVKDQVNIPIFEEQGDIRQIFLKISSCLPVKVSREDKLPKKICDGCSNKLDLLYEFWNTSANAEKTLLSWLGQAGVKDVDQTITAVAQQIAKPSEPQVKEETPEDGHAAVQNTDHLGISNSAVLDDSSAKDETEEPPPKRARRTAAVKAQINLTPDSEEEDDDLDTAEPMTKIEDESDESDNDDKDPSYVDVPGTSADDQPGPSGVGKDGAEAPYFDTSILNNLIYGPGISITPIKREVDAAPEHMNPQTNFLNYNNFDNIHPFNGFSNAALAQVLETEIGANMDAFQPKNAVKSEPSILQSLTKGLDIPMPNPGIVKKEPNILECLLSEKIRKRRMRQDKAAEKHPPPIELDEPIQCDICNETYKNNVAFALHSIVHSGDNKYRCHLCEYKNSSKYHIEMHIRAHEGTTKYKCEICGKAFTISTHAFEHKYFHTGEKPFQCEICGKHFMFSWFLTSHRRTQHWEIVTGSPLVKYDCNICNKHYTSSTGLKRHNMNHHGIPGADDSCLCDICGKSLSSKEKLKFHRRIHTGYKPFSCEICTKSFSRKEQLKEHERVHTGEKPYICKFCGKGFTQRSPLRIHERTHTGERPYKCMICQKGFISKGVMDTHMKNCSVSRTEYDDDYDL
ncbi:endothelial zinc finger protein induced by tumor necrosis factor alpha-like isoform X7 [Sitophilus oryzae]|uniref:Endothelial zinc finger protein induced by tumor necrosis factor alpha-like isoform X7 n=1 Tax=Sitophilus oryzae TaxID=7048 RepID=A0A6J2XQ58_SITOR|nr:endothelial zinc finger protein induced by tumor necrosis factor alpha-like isoform X7 [Sitophilus oryzae]